MDLYDILQLLQKIRERRKRKIQEKIAEYKLSLYIQHGDPNDILELLESNEELQEQKANPEFDKLDALKQRMNMQRGGK